MKWKISKTLEKIIKYGALWLGSGFLAYSTNNPYLVAIAPIVHVLVDVLKHQLEVGNVPAK